MFKHDFNFHSHTYLCGHAGGIPIDYVNEAIKNNFSVLGISEHAPMTMLPNYNSRLKNEDYPKYLELLHEADLVAEKHNIKLYKGLEIEYVGKSDVYLKFLDDLDYLVLGQHYIYVDGKLKSTYDLSTLEDIIIYSNTLIEAIKTGYFNLVAHPDLCFYNIENPTKEMYQALIPFIKLAKQLDIPLEVNANGFRRNLYEKSPYLKYPRTQFFQMVAKENAKVISSSDAHSPEQLNDHFIKVAYQFANELNLNIINTLNMSYYHK